MDGGGRIGIVYGQGCRTHPRYKFNMPARCAGEIKSSTPGCRDIFQWVLYIPKDPGQMLLS